MNIWIVNPFDQLPNETDVPLRYWALCRTFAERGHTVVWWSSDFSHLTKSMRSDCLDTDGFSVRLIETPPYKKNISFARLRNHKAFAEGFYREAMKSLDQNELEAPDRIVVSLPPLGVAEQALKIRDRINHSLSTSSSGSCQVVIDIMDAWPETFYQVLPNYLRKHLGAVLFANMHRSARRAYQGADKITAVGQSYLDLAKSYGAGTLPPPMHLCYHGAELSRFSTDSATTHCPNTPLKAVYIGAMGSGYDLQTILELAARWRAEKRFPFQIHFAGSGPKEPQLIKRSKSLISEGRVVFHGQIGRDAVDQLLKSADLALVPNRPSSLVACPYKAGEYAAAGLPILSCLGGELGELLKHWSAGTEYEQGEVESLHNAFENYLLDPNLQHEQSLNARKMAEALFDRQICYPQLAEFIKVPVVQTNAADNARD